jgi:hypothetical protein
MGVISPVNQLQFKPTVELFTRVRKFLSSFDAAGQIDEGDFYHYVKDTLAEVGIYYYQEQEAILELRDYKAALPENFYQLYAAYKCMPGGEPKPIMPEQLFDKMEWVRENGQPDNACEINCQRQDKTFMITVRTYISGSLCTRHFHSPMLLRLSPHVKPKFCAEGCRNLHITAPDEITIDEGIIYSNFTRSTIYLQYYGFPIDEQSGLPLIPQDTHIEKAIEYYILFKTLETLWLNNQAPDIETRVKYLNGQYEFHLAKAKYNAKLPSFQTMIAHIRERRGRFDIYNRLTDNTTRAWYRA